MKVSELAEKLGFEIVSGKEGLDKQVVGGYACDLLSDVMGNAGEGQVWVTLQTHKNVMAIASLKDLAAIVLVKGLKPDKDMEAQSHEEGVPVLSTKEEAFETAGRIFELIK
ncbi:MAG: serine kinase [Bacteroidales bacterium]|nr:serine kinase [Bacteroidales bacterium]